MCSNSGEFRAETVFFVGDKRRHDIRCHCKRIANFRRGGTVGDGWNKKVRNYGYVYCPIKREQWIHQKCNN
jgi:hypothetical protein